ncbi:MAG: hypothetical protein ACP5XB_22100 [Isosphaeraceae bacterium]
MSSLLALPLLWAQAGAPKTPIVQQMPHWFEIMIAWLYVWGDPVALPENSPWAPWMLWIKAISLLSLVGWLGSWIVTAVRERYLIRNRWYDYAALIAIIFIPLTMLLRTLEAAKQVPTYNLASTSIPIATLMAFVIILVLGLWAELGVWRTIRRFGQSHDILVLIGIHVGLLLGITLGVVMERAGILSALLRGLKTTWRDGISFGMRSSLTYMGYAVLARMIVSLVREFYAIRGRRLYSIARLSIHEAFRRMWAPWVVLIIFGLVLAFTHWFLIPPRAAEMGRLFVGTLSLVCSLLVTVMVAILTPLSLPNDIQQQTIHTVVCKPVRRLELVWGRMLGFMAIVTVLVVLFGGVSLFYLWRQVNTTIVNTEAAALKAKGYDLVLLSSAKDVGDIPAEGKNLVIVAQVGPDLHFRIFDGNGQKVVDAGPRDLKEHARQIKDLQNQLSGLWPPHEPVTWSERDQVISTVTSMVGHTEARPGNEREYNQLVEGADQLRARMAARVPVMGSLSFLDSKGNPHAMGIDVGMEQSTMKQPRSHIEGATPATAIWKYGRVVDPFSLPGHPIFLNRRINVAEFLPPETIEGLLDRVSGIQEKVKEDERTKQQPDLPAAELAKVNNLLARHNDELKRATSEYEQLLKRAEDLEAQAVQADKAGNAQQAGELRQQAQELHAEPIKVEMSFNVYRTTKGRVGDPVLAQMEVTNPRTLDSSVDIFPIKEYYTNQRLIDPKILAGSHGELTIEIRCISPTQYLGMAESDLYLLSSSGNFGTNFMKGLFGVWLQAMVLCAIGIFAGTFLSWPVALLTTIAFFFAGQLAYSFLVDFTRQNILGGGPFESLIRLVTHDNQMSQLDPTWGVVIAKTLDSLVMPVMSMLVYVVPNFQALDVSNTVADGFAVSWGTMISNTLLALAYALPFSIVGYFILKNREVAA